MLRHVLKSEHGSLFYEPNDNVRSMYNLGGFTFEHLEWEAYAWPGGYEIHYYTKDNGVLCHQCANKELMRTIDPDDEQFYIVDSDANYESDDVYCDHCNRKIEPAYGEDEELQKELDDQRRADFDAEMRRDAFGDDK